jgi:hypothetical protein
MTEGGEVFAERKKTGIIGAECSLQDFDMPRAIGDDPSHPIIHSSFGSKICSKTTGSAIRPIC